ncbi:MAG: hypothetical protein J5658_02535 [Prevotella sp.]|nr:hypothetical protein [Prevotella sp.]
MLLESAREAIGCPIIINSGFRCEAVNRRVGDVAGSTSPGTPSASPATTSASCTINGKN